MNDCVQSVPDTVRNEKAPRIISDTYNIFNNKNDILHNKMQSIVELYESLNIVSFGNGIDIKLPPCND